MSGWLAIDTTAVRAYAHNARISAAWDASTDAQETAWFAQVRDGVTARIRARIAQRISLDADGTKLPPELVELACLQVLSAVLARLGAVGQNAEGNVFTLTQEQRDRIRDGNKLLDEIAAGHARVTPPDTGATTSADFGAAPQVRVASSTERRFTRDSLDGL